MWVIFQGVRNKEKEISTWLNSSLKKSSYGLITLSFYAGGKTTLRKIRKRN